MPPPSRPYGALKHVDLRRYAGGMLVSLVGSAMQNTAIDWHVWQLTGSPLALGAVGLVRIVPIVAFSLLGGLAADRVDRRRLLLVTQSVMLTAALALAALTSARRESLAAIYLLTAVSAGATAFDSPARHAFLPRLVPLRDLPGALAVMMTVFQLAAIAGPALAGLLLSRGGGAGPEVFPRGGLAAVYGLNAASFLAVIAALLRMKVSGEIRAGAVPERPLTALGEGLRYVFRTPVMVWTMILDFVATLFAGSMSLLPIFADQILKVGPHGYGWLRAAPGLGAALGSAIVSFRSLPRRQGPVLLWAVAAYGAATAAFGLSRSFALTLAALVGVGLSDIVSTVVRQTVRQLATPDALRGRVTSVNMVFFQGGPQLGELEAGVVASLFASAALGATVAVATGGMATILVAAFVAWRAPFLRQYDVEPILRVADEEPSRAAAS